MKKTSGASCVQDQGLKLSTEAIMKCLKVIRTLQCTSYFELQRQDFSLKKDRFALITWSSTDMKGLHPVKESRCFYRHILVKISMTQYHFPNKKQSQKTCFSWTIFSPKHELQNCNLIFINFLVWTPCHSCAITTHQHTKNAPQALHYASILDFFSCGSVTTPVLFLLF